MPRGALPKPPKILPGQKFSRWTSLEWVGRDKYGKHLWHCSCECGGEKVVPERYLLDGQSKSCGCVFTEYMQARNRQSATHRLSRTPLYKIWTGLKDRCHNPKSHTWKDYGGRGITVCERWDNSFEAFMEDMGQRPSPKHSIDRIDPNGNYEPSNCRWATSAEQARNRRNSTLVEVDGVKRTLGEVSVMLGGNRHLVRSRVCNGWSIEKAISTPLVPPGPVRWRDRNRRT